MPTSRVFIASLALVAAACSSAPSRPAADPTDETPPTRPDDASPATTTSSPAPEPPSLTSSDGPADLVVVDPVQPSVEVTERIDQVIDRSSIPESDGYGTQQATVVVDDIPYSRYWQLDDPDLFVLHPMVVGRYVFTTADDPDVATRNAEIIAEIGSPLPDGSVAFYYPNRYPLNRMSGPDYVYSAISQSEILAGFVRADQLHPSDLTRRQLDDVLGALFFPYERGGVDLAGVAQLELPLLRSNPEIILNGWLHSLLHLVDYAEIYDDEDVSEYIVANLRFFADNHAAWYDEERHISRYSDTSPIRVIIQPSSPDSEPALHVEYRAIPDELDDYRFDVADDPDGRLSGYDNKVAARNPDTGALTTTVTCSTLFEVDVVTDQPFTASFHVDGYDPERATPDLTGPRVERSSTDDGTGSHRISLADPDLICGYPTNFAKASGLNFYHMQHVVALLLLAESDPVDDELATALRAVAAEWYRAIEGFEPRAIEDFEPPQEVLDRINRGKYSIAEDDADALFARAGIEIFAEHR